MNASTQPSGSFLLDTNIVIAIFATEQAVLARLSGTSAVFVPIFVIGELFFGAYNSSRVQANVARVQQFAAASAVRCSQMSPRRSTTGNSRPSCVPWGGHCQKTTCGSRPSRANMG